MPVCLDMAQQFANNLLNTPKPFRPDLKLIEVDFKYQNMCTTEENNILEINSIFMYII